MDVINSTVVNATTNVSHFDPEPEVMNATSGGGLMDWRVRVVWDAMFFSIISVAIVGNLIVLWIIIGEKEGAKY